MKYVSTIPHTGTFRMYLTEPGYDPSKPLKWSDLPERPFAEVKDPALTDGAYRIRMTLPKDRTGRQVLYTIWQNSSTADTYYSCSDVVFPAAEDKSGDGAAAPAASPTRSRAAEKKPATSPAPSTPAATPTPACPSPVPRARWPPTPRRWPPTRTATPDRPRPCLRAAPPRCWCSPGAPPWRFVCADAELRAHSVQLT